MCKEKAEAGEIVESCSNFVSGKVSVLNLFSNTYYYKLFYTGI